MAITYHLASDLVMRYTEVVYSFIYLKSKRKKVFALHKNIGSTGQHAENIFA